MTKICQHCGETKMLTGTKMRYYYCRRCARERMKRIRDVGRGGSPKSLAGARESLARYLDAHWDTAKYRIAELIEHPYATYSDSESNAA